MNEFDRALADIVNMRVRLAASGMFQGFGPTVMALTGGLAVATATLQSTWPNLLAADQKTYLLCWIVTAVVCTTMIGIEMVARARRIHAGLADAFIINAIESFLPAGLAGAAITLALFQFSPETLWILPGLWQVMVSLGIFAAIRSLPRSINLVGAWYLLSGLTVLVIAAQDPATQQILDPWLMGMPFAIGQFLMAGVLWQSSGEVDDEQD